MILSADIQSLPEESCIIFCVFLMLMSRFLNQRKKSTFYSCSKEISVGRSRSDFHIEDILFCADHPHAKRISTSFLVVLNHEPRYWKSSACLVTLRIYLVLLIKTHNFNCPAASSTQYNSVTLSWIMPETKAMSSAKSVLVKLISGCPLLLRC